MVADPGLSLERFASVSAEVAAGAALEVVLRREAIEPRAWEIAKQAWLAAMAAEMATQRFEVTARYQETFRARRRALTAVGKTTLDGTAPVGGADAALPFRAAGGPQALRLGIEQLASLAAEIARAKEDRGAILLRYGLDEAAYAAELAVWTRRFGTEAGLLSRYDALLSSYLEWLARSGR